MSEELEHIDTIFSDKLKNHREKPSALAWDKLANALDEKDKGAQSSGNKGNIGLLSVTVISFMFLFSGHEMAIPQKPVSNKIAPVQIEEPISTPLPKQATTKTDKETAVEKTITTNVIQNLKTTDVQNTNSTAATENITEENVSTDIAAETLLINDVAIDKKPTVKLRATQKTTDQNKKGIKVEITLDASGIDETKRETAPQTKNTLNTIFKKLRKFSESSKKN